MGDARRLTAEKSCHTCPEKHSEYASWTCANCEFKQSPRAGLVTRLLLWKRLSDAGYPLDRSGLSLWELLLLARLKEEDHG